MNLKEKLALESTLRELRRVNIREYRRVLSCVAVLVGLQPFSASHAHADFIAFAKIVAEHPEAEVDYVVILEIARKPHMRPYRCGRLVPFLHGCLGLGVSALILWLSPESRWVAYLAAIPGLYGLYNLKSAFFDSHDELDRKLNGDDLAKFDTGMNVIGLKRFAYNR